MDFFHCNHCYTQPGFQQNITFCLTSCGHTFCSDCAKKGESKCKVCMNDCQFVAINNDMPDTLKQLFSDPVKEVRKAVKIMSIQLKHCKIYMEEYVPKLECKYAQAKIAIENSKNEEEKCKKIIDKNETEIKILRTQIVKLKNVVEEQRKQLSVIQNRQPRNFSPTLPSSPSNFGCMQDGFFTSMTNSNANKSATSSSFNFMNRKNNSSISSPLARASPGQEKRKLTAMELLFKNKEASLRSPCTPRTPSMRSNQTFNMSVNVTPPESYNSDDSEGPFSDMIKMPSPSDIRLKHNFRPTSDINYFQKRNSGVMQPSSSRSKYFHTK